MDGARLKGERVADSSESAGLPKHVRALWRQGYFLRKQRQLTLQLSLPVSPFGWPSECSVMCHKDTCACV